MWCGERVAGGGGVVDVVRSRVRVGDGAEDVPERDGRATDVRGLAHKRVQTGFVTQTE